MSEVSRVKRLSINVGAASVIVVGLLAGIGVAYQYYSTTYGTWTVGAAAVGIGMAVAAGTVLTVVVLRWFLLDPGAAASARRFMLGAVAFSLAVVGALAGAGAGYAYQDAGGGIVEAVFVGLGSAIGAWIAAALLGTFLEMADSLRSIAFAARAASDE